MMEKRDVYRELQGIRNDSEFAEKSGRLTEQWTAAELDITAVKSVLKFMEENGTVDYGMPGPLVHYVETYFGKGYEALLVQSVSRAPTEHTLWMLNRLINGTKDRATRQAYVVVLQSAARSPDPTVADAARHFLEVQRQG